MSAFAPKSELEAYAERLKSSLSSSPSLPSPSFLSPLSVDDLLLVKEKLETYSTYIETRINDGLKDEHYEEYEDETISTQDFDKILDNAIDKRLKNLQGEIREINYIRDKIQKFMEKAKESS